MTNRIEALVNPEMLIWTRKKTGFDIDDVAKHIKVKPECFQSWEKGDLRPTIKQAIRLAEVYRHPLSTFYLDTPPSDFSVTMTDFRRSSNTEQTDFSPGLIREIRHAKACREIMLELTDSEEDSIFSQLNSISLADDYNIVAQQTRNILNISWKVQKKWGSANKALNGWKEAIEKLNVLVFHSSHHNSSLTLNPSEAHGFSISENLFPVIVVNSKDSHNRRIFTLLHEFAHLLLNAGGVCDMWEHSTIKSRQQRIEVFCNHIAGAILIPEDLLLKHQAVSSHPTQNEWSEEEIATLADDFSTSKELLVRRLLMVQLTTPQFYEHKRQEYQQAWLELKKNPKKSTGGGPPYHRMVLRKNGRSFTRHVLSAYYDNKITLSDVSDYLGVKIKHIKKMEQELFSIKTGA